MLSHRSIVRPIDAVAGLLPDQAQVKAAVAALLEDGFNPYPVRPQRLNDHRKQDWGPDTTIMNLYLAGQHQGHVLLVVPALRSQREQVGRLLSRHHGHAVYYFTTTGVESLSVLV